MRSGETVDWLISIGKTYDAADILPPIWGLGDTEADIVPRSLWMASEIDSDEFETGTSINGHYKTLQDHANTIEELAALINVPADTLKEEIDTWNAYGASGKDLRLAPRGRPDRRGRRPPPIAESVWLARSFPPQGRCQLFEKGRAPVTDARPSFRAAGRAPRAIESQIRYTALCTCLQIP